MSRRFQSIKDKFVRKLLPLIEFNKNLKKPIKSVILLL